MHLKELESLYVYRNTMLCITNTVIHDCQGVLAAIKYEDYAKYICVDIPKNIVKHSHQCVRVVEYIASPAANMAEAI